MVYINLFTYFQPNSYDYYVIIVHNYNIGCYLNPTIFTATMNTIDQLTGVKTAAKVFVFLAHPVYTTCHALFASWRVKSDYKVRNNWVVFFKS